MVDAAELVREYVRLGLRIGRLDPGSASARAVERRSRSVIDREPVSAPGVLAERAALLCAVVPDVGFVPARAAFLSGQLAALECRAHRLAGWRTSFRAEAAACFGLRVEFGEPDRYRSAHAELAELLPGSGPPADRLALLAARERVPPTRLARGVAALSRALRARVRAEPGLPVQEGVDYRYVRGRSWSALHRYLGDFRSLVAVDPDRQVWAGRLPGLVAHESYPGHHAEHCRKERVLVGARGWSEHGVEVRDSPQSLLAEGIAESGLRIAVGPGWGRWAQEVLAEVGIAFDGDRAERVLDALDGLRRVRSDAALLLHDGPGPAAAAAHLRRWSCLPEEGVRAFLRFAADPCWRLHVVTYAEGLPVVARRLAAGEAVGRLLDEPWAPGG